MKDKPIHTMDLIPTPKTFGTIGFVLFYASLFFIIWMYTQYGLMGFIVGSIIFVFGGFAGREFENTHHKEVMNHMPQKFQDLYNKTAKDIVKKEIKDAKVKVKN